MSGELSNESGRGAAPSRASASTQPTRRLAAIMFTDLVGYSALAHKDEALAIELLELHRGWVREILPTHGGQEIETVGDAFLIEFAGALAAVECATAIQQRFTDHNATAPEARRMQLRIGIHLGDVEHKDGKVMGDGVNIASRIHGMAEPGGICVSETAYHVIRNRAGLGFVSIGAPKLKNISTSLELYRLATGPLVGRRWTSRARQVAALATVLALLAALGAWFGLSGRAPAADPTIAVLPFANMSTDRENEYFADGMHDTLLTNLTRIRDLKVISRTSVMEYRNAARNLREIGKALGVAHIVEGSVQRQGSRVRITAQLVRVANDEHLWAETYDRDVADVFAIQSEVAQRIASSIRARLTSAEKRRIEQRPTDNTEAYELYLRGRHEWQNAEQGREQLERTIALHDRATALDPEFALNIAVVSQLHGNMYWLDYDRSEARMALALRNARHALELDPDLHEGKMALARYYRLRREYDRAYPLYLELAQARPNDSETVAALGFVERRQGRFAEAVRHLRQAIEGDPLNATHRGALAEVLILARDYAGAEAVLRRALDLPGVHVWETAVQATVQMIWKGDFSGIAALPDRGGGPEGDDMFRRYVGYLWSGQYERAIAVANAWPGDFMPMTDVALGCNFTYPKAYLRGQAYRAKGDSAAAAREFRMAKSVLETAIARQPDDARLYATLGPTLAALGENQAALSAARTATEMLPVSLDAMVGPVMIQMLAQTQAWVGDTDAALASLKTLLEAPTHVTAHALRLNPVWQPLRADPRFQKLIAEHLPKD